MDAEGNATRASEAVEKLASAACQRSGLVFKLRFQKPSQLEVLEEDLKDSMNILKDKNRIFGKSLSVDEFLDPIEEREDLDIAAETFEDDDAIITEVRRREAVRNGDVMEVDSASSDEESARPMATSELITLTQQLETEYISRVAVDSSPEFLHHLRMFRAKLHRDQLQNAKQTTLSSHGFVKLA